MVALYLCAVCTLHCPLCMHSQLKGKQNGRKKKKDYANQSMLMHKYDYQKRIMAPFTNNAYFHSFFFLFRCTNNRKNRKFYFFYSAFYFQPSDHDHHLPSFCEIVATCNHKYNASIEKNENTKQKH